MIAKHDVLVVGAGPAGLSAALTASRSGGRIILCDEQSELGGSLLSEAPEDGATIDGFHSRDWLRQAVTQLTNYPAVTLLPRTTAFGYFPHNLVGLNQRLTDHLGSLPANMPRPSSG